MLTLDQLDDFIERYDNMSCRPFAQWPSYQELVNDGNEKDADLLAESLEGVILSTILKYLKGDFTIVGQPISDCIVEFAKLLGDLREAVNH